ncbi:hypothetical protein KFL_006500020 [Klebsormidium nitens]|uniref:SAND domain-containing protein n=1 Tax=Klebsormidium nitens TaxID=105231 RepID=A0A1Y1IQU2_KLENI|nr:hypothetical protein KFL_006500020 [Klebsormidium nitens]|eukprot:GAQ90508.1 hypothetical protein KFL_006500020 [Klebsormidium nitens]
MLQDAVHSSGSLPLEVQLAGMFSRGGLLEDARLGGMHVGRLMAKITASFESLKEHQADEIAALKRGFRLEIEKLLGDIPGDRKETGQDVAGFWHDELETRRSHEGSDPSSNTEESSEQAITTNCTETVCLQNNEISEWDPQDCTELAMVCSDPPAEHRTMQGVDRSPPFPAPLAGTCKRAWDSMEMLQRTHGSHCHVDQPVSGDLPGWGQGLLSPASVLPTASFSEQSGMSSEWGAEARDTAGSSAWGPRSEEADRESERLNLALQPEQRIDDSQDAPWRKEAAEAKRRFEDSLAQSWAPEQAAKPGVPDYSATHEPQTTTRNARPWLLAFTPDPKPLHGRRRHPGHCSFPRGQARPAQPESLPRLPQPRARAEASPAAATPLFPSIKRARTKRLVAAVQVAVLALPCPFPPTAAEQRLPPPQPPVAADHGQPLTSPAAPASPRSPAPSSLSPSALLADETVHKYQAFCKPKSGTEGANFEGTLCVMRSKRAIVICACRDCVETHGAAGRGLSPVEFEAHAGRLHHKKWRQSIWVRLPAAGGPRETTVEQCRALQGGKHLVSVPAAPDAPPVRTSSQAPGRLRHSGSSGVSRCTTTRNSASTFHKAEEGPSKE